MNIIPSPVLTKPFHTWHLLVPSSPEPVTYPPVRPSPSQNANDVPQYGNISCSRFTPHVPQEGLSSPRRSGTEVSSQVVPVTSAVDEARGRATSPFLCLILDAVAGRERLVPHIAAGTEPPA